MDDARVLRALGAFLDLNPDVGDFRAEVLEGLSRPQKALPCKFFYDERGSELFHEICYLEEYYPTRTEIGILEARVGEIADLVGSGVHLIELGSGASIKIRTLLNALPDLARYTGVDISRDFLLQSTAALAQDYPDLDVAAVCADYTRTFPVPESEEAAGARKVGFFPGSTIGNFPPDEAKAFLGGIADILGPGGGLLIGVDLRKDPDRLYAAYNDSEGVTAAFNLNLLSRANAELGADFDLAAFRHDAPYLEDVGRVEMRLYSERDQSVHIDGTRFDFGAGEYIHTESSHKYSLDGFRALCETVGYRPVAAWTDPEDLFSVHYFSVG